MEFIRKDRKACGIDKVMFGEMKRWMGKIRVADPFECDQKEGKEKLNYLSLF